MRKVGPVGMTSIECVTVGCKLNQFETELMREAAREELGAAPDEKARQICIVNTCTVTAKSDYRSRQAVRRAIKANPGALIVVTGCYAQRRPEEVAAIEGVDVVLGNAEKDRIADFVRLPKQARAQIWANPASEIRWRADRCLHRFGDYTRAFVKIQDGCNNCCSYCVVPSVRGRSRSKGADEVIREIEVLSDSGYREVVLTGVHLGSYGQDLRPATSLSCLLERIGEVPGVERIRLSSVEPTDFSDSLVELLSDPSSKICPHAHVPLQSGDDRILASMRRPYGSAFYRELIERIAQAVPRCGIGIDVIVGYPTEDEQAFGNTCKLIEDLPVSYLHAFAFSEREGTPACALEPKVEPQVKRRRSRAVRDLGRRKAEAFRRGLVGNTLRVLVLRSRTDGHATGLSGNYVRVTLDRDEPVNSIVSVKVTGVTNSGVSGEVLSGRDKARA